MRGRFGSAGLIAGAMASALACYTVSLRVAAERSDVDRARRTIAADLKDIRALEAELRTRARLPQLQRWNDEVLAMSAPTSKQFANGALALAAYAPGATEPVSRTPNVQLAVASESAVPPPRVQTVAYSTEPPTTTESQSAPAKREPSAPVRVAEARPFALPDSLLRQIETAATAEQITFRKVSMQ